MGNVYSRLAIVLLLSAILSFGTGFAIAYHLVRRYPENVMTIYQEIEVKNPEGGDSGAGTHGYDFTWEQITADRAFQRELALRIFGPNETRFMAPHFNASTFFRLLPHPGKLTLMMNVPGGFAGDEAQRFGDFNTGMKLFLEKLKEHGVEGKPIDIPRRFHYGGEDDLKTALQSALYLSVIPALVAAVSGYFIMLRLNKRSAGRV